MAGLLTCPGHRAPLVQVPVAKKFDVRFVTHSSGYCPDFHWGVHSEGVNLPETISRLPKLSILHINSK